MFVPPGFAMVTEWTLYFTTIQSNRLDDTVKYLLEIIKSSLDCNLELFKLFVLVHLLSCWCCYGYTKTSITHSMFAYIIIYGKLVNMGGF